MAMHEIEKHNSPPSPNRSYAESFKIEETAIDNFGAEEDNNSIVNEFGHGNGNFMTAFFNVTCIVAGTGTLGLPRKFFFCVISTTSLIYISNRRFCTWWLARYPYHDVGLLYVCL